MKIQAIGHIIKWILISVILQYFISCKSPHDLINFNDIKQGNYLGEASEITVDTFISLWIENETPYKFDFNLNKLYKDSIFTYFGKQTFKYQSFYKVRNENLYDIDYQSIIGDSIRKKFYYEIIPIEDKNKQNKCSSAFIDFDYTYKYIKNENSIEVKCRYKVLCEFLFNIIKKDYSAKYNIENKTIFRTDLKEQKKIRK